MLVATPDTPNAALGYIVWRQSFGGMLRLPVGFCCAYRVEGHVVETIENCLHFKGALECTEVPYAWHVRP